MDVEVSGNFKAITPQTKICRNFLKDFSINITTERKKGLAIKEVCSVLQKQLMEGDNDLVPRM